MTRIGGIPGRTTAQLTSARLLAQLRRTQLALQESQDQVSTGKQVTRPSDAPAKSAAILTLQKQLEAREQHERNLSHATGLLNNVDHALGDATDRLIEARSIASSQIGIGSNTDTRNNQAHVIDAHLKTLIDVANRRFEGISLFGGSLNPHGSEPIFEEFLGGVRYRGTRDNLAGDLGLDRPLDVNANGEDAFGALSARVKGTVDLDPQATPATRLADVAGALGEGVRRGTVVLTVDATQVRVDLSDAETLGDVVTRVNAAIGSIDASAGNLALSGAGFALTAAGGRTISLSDLSGNQTAADLGVTLAATGATVAGGDVGVGLTEQTTLASLGAAIDWTSGLKITQGIHTKVAEFSGAATVQDLMNVIESLGLGLRLEINDARDGLNLVSEVSGLELSVGENGGTTAEDLGLQTFGGATLLSDFNLGRSVSNVQGEDDFEVRLHDGTSFRVNIDGLTRVGDVVSAIAAAAAGAGLTVGAPGGTTNDFNVGLASDGNGLVLEDRTAGAGDFAVEELGLSLAAHDLGIHGSAGAGGTINGGDVTKVRVEGVFTHLIALRDALAGDDSRGITVAGGAIESDVENLARVRADVGVRSQRIEQQQQRSAELKLAEGTLLSDLQDADLSEVITRFAQLQQQLQASLQVGAQNLRMSLLDFLR